MIFEKIHFCSWEASGSRYFVWRIVLGCGGVWGARNIVNFIKIIKIHGFDKDIADPCHVFVQPAETREYTCGGLISEMNHRFTFKPDGKCAYYDCL